MVDLGYLKWQLRRGKLELDVVLQRFLTRYPLDQLAMNELEALEKVLSKSDDELLNLFLRRTAAADDDQIALIEKILSVPAGSPE
ncbi:MAG: succinate dehydrogenase assembly factor 2 [Immundisolibacteraceae bacterium]|nr:succinate dehydrogenase assembly factor 2 [Immundisolibacteraceae bacterium]